MRLTQNFSAAEFDVHEPWPADKYDNRQRLALLLQWFRDLAGVPGVIASAYRSPARNAQVGGADHSQHMEAEAADVVFAGITDRELTRRLLEAERLGKAPAYGQFIVYEDTGHTHISLGTRRQKLVASKHNGVRSYRTIVSASDVPRIGQTTVSALLLLAGVLALAFILAHLGASHRV